MSVQRIEGLLTVYVDEIYLFTVPNDICDFFLPKKVNYRAPEILKYISKPFTKSSIC